MTPSPSEHLSPQDLHYIKSVMNSGTKDELQKFFESPTGTHFEVCEKCHAELLKLEKETREKLLSSIVQPS
jgi:hypothetical protein